MPDNTLEDAVAALGIMTGPELLEFLWKTVQERDHVIEQCPTGTFLVCESGSTRISVSAEPDRGFARIVEIKQHGEPLMLIAEEFTGRLHMVWERPKFTGCADSVN